MIRTVAQPGLLSLASAPGRTKTKLPMLADELRLDGSGLGGGGLGLGDDGMGLEEAGLLGLVAAGWDETAGARQDLHQLNHSTPLNIRHVVPHSVLARRRRGLKSGMRCAGWVAVGWGSEEEVHIYIYRDARCATYGLKMGGWLRACVAEAA